MGVILNASYLQGVALNVLVFSSVSFICGAVLQVLVNVLSTLIPSNESISVNMFISMNILTVFFLMLIPAFSHVQDFYLSCIAATVTVVLVLNLVFAYLSIKDSNPSNISYFQSLLNTIPYMGVVLFPTLLVLLYCLIRYITWK